MITLDYLTKNYPHHLLFQDLTMKIKPGELTAIQGRIGSGKTTLLKIIAGLDTSYQGTCSIGGKTYSKNDKILADFRLEHIGYIPQDIQLLEDVTCMENIALPLKFLKHSKSERIKKAKEIMKELGLTDLEEKYPKEISGGQKQMVAIARALAKSPTIILADEPTAGLDKATEEQVLQCLKHRQSEHTYIIIATHSKEVSEQCDQIIELDDLQYT